MTARAEAWAAYKAALATSMMPPFKELDRDEWKKRLHEAALADWADFDTSTYKGGVVATYPVLRYTLELVSHTRHYRKPVYVAVTEPCLFCGEKHTHGAADGSRSPHCTDHSHDRTPTGRKKNIYAKNTIHCPGCAGGYVLRKAQA